MYELGGGRAASGEGLVMPSPLIVVVSKHSTRRLLNLSRFTEHCHSLILYRFFLYQHTLFHTRNIILLYYLLLYYCARTIREQ